MDTKPVKKKTDEEEKLAEIEKLRVQIEKRLIKLSNSTDNDLYKQSTNLDANDGVTGDPMRDAYEMALQAERATTVKSFLPKFFNLFLRKQNIVNRRLISAIRFLAESVNIVYSRIDGFRELVESNQKAISQNQKEISQNQKAISQNQKAISQNQEKVHNLQNKINNLMFVASTHESSQSKSSVKDDFYHSFTNRFRGSYELISKKLNFYLHKLGEHFGDENTENKLALDLGFGRGEWLDLMNKNSIRCIGVDSNILFYNECKGRSLEVEHIDILKALAKANDESYDVISAFHVVEHFDISIQLHFFSEIFRVLKKGGIMFIETPFNANLDVGATGFYHDPTHIRPLHEELGKFISDYIGFVDIETHHLNPDDSYENDNPVQKRISGPRDLAIIARKAL